MISCLNGCEQLYWAGLRTDLPATDDKEYERCSAESTIDTQIIPKALVGELIVVFGPHLDPDSWSFCVSE